MPKLKSAHELWKSNVWQHTIKDINDLLDEWLSKFQDISIPASLCVYLHLLYGCAIDDEVSPSAFGLSYLHDRVRREFFTWGDGNAISGLEISIDQIYTTFTQKVSQSFCMRQEMVLQNMDVESAYIERESEGWKSTSST